MRIDVVPDQRQEQYSQQFGADAHNYGALSSGYESEELQALRAILPLRQVPNVRLWTRLKFKTLWRQEPTNIQYQQHRCPSTSICGQVR